MKKLYILLLGICLAWLIKLSYDVFKISALQSNLLQSSHQLEKVTSNLNDQLVALKRVKQEKKEESVSSTEQTGLNQLPNDLIKQQLTLIEFSLKQNQYYYALEKLIELNQALSTYPISPELKQSLGQAIEKDIEGLKKYISNQDEQEKVTQKILQQLDLELKQEALNTHLTPAKVQDQYFWQKWISIDSVDTPATQLAQRAFMIKEAQLRLLMARQVFISGEFAQYQTEISEIQSLLKSLPDQKAKQIIQQLESLKKRTKNSTPKLITRTLMG